MAEVVTPTSSNAANDAADQTPSQSSHGTDGLITNGKKLIQNAQNGASTPVAEAQADDEEKEVEDGRDNTAAKPASKSGTFVSDDNHVPQDQSGIDPLSQHILKRTQTDKSITPKLRPPPANAAEAGGTSGILKQNSAERPGSRGEAAAASKPSKEKKKGVSFLSRFIGTKKKDSPSEATDNASEQGDGTINGGDEIFAHPIGFIPRFPPPPRYIKVKAHYKKTKTFDRLFLAQELRGSGDAADEKQDAKSTDHKAVWALEFSKNGKYLAVAGQDKVVRVWAVITNSEDREAHELEEDHQAKGDDQGLRLTAPVFKSKPLQEYEGHSGSILDLSWSKNNFLLSSSMDKTVRLWHVSRPECLCCFKHSDFVTSIQFHPRDDRFFLAGSLDSKLRLWSIPDKSVAFWANVADMITAVAFTPDGKHAIAGCLNGLCILYETEGLKATSQIHVRSARGRNAKGSKITGIDTIVQPPNDPNGEIKLLITSNDSRIRLYDFRDRSLEAKFRGNENSTSQIRASFSDDGKYIICGSEDRRAYIWSARSDDKETDKRAVEVLETRTAIVTSAIMAPTATRQLLGLSGDPLYDICNPPPITLVSQTESVLSSKPGAKEPAESAKNNTAHENPAYLARSAHPGGHIIIAADYFGRVKVFRQDCAYNKRPAEFWDTSSIFSKKRLGRSNSARQSIASSIGKESKSPSERILAWRSSVVGTEITSIDPRARGARSTSPRKSLSRQSGKASSIQSPAPTASKTESGYETPQSGSRRSTDLKTDSIAEPESEGDLTTPHADFQSPVESPSGPEAAPASSSNRSPSDQATGWLGGQSYAFWSKTKNTVEAMRTQKYLSPQDADGGRRKSSVPSALSSDLSSVHSGDADEGEVLRCTRCRATNFRATKTKSGKQKLVCVKCNTVHD